MFYQTQYTDPDTGDVMMQSRWYSPGTGTFRSRDTYAGNLNTPVSLNRYTYAHNNPIRYADPTGFCVEICNGRLGPGNSVDGVLAHQYNNRTGVRTLPPRNGIGDSTIIIQGTSDRVAPSTTESTQAVFDIFASERSSTLVWDGGRAIVPNRDNSITGIDFFDGGLLAIGGSIDATARAFLNPIDTTKGVISTATCGMEVSACLAMATAQGVAVGAADAHDEYGADGAAGFVVATGLEALFGLRGVGAISKLDNLTVAAAPRVVDDVVPSQRQVNTYTPNSAAFCSFSGETGVLMADGTTKPISDIEIGDKVLAFDPETGERGEREVTHLWEHQDTLVDLHIGDTTVTTTEDHPFWNHSDREWQRADQLDGGDYVLTAYGDLLPVEGINPDSQYSATAYNLTVNDIHTYYVQVGDDGVLVHNTCGDELVTRFHYTDNSGFNGINSTSPIVIRAQSPSVRPNNPTGAYVTSQSPDTLVRGKVGLTQSSSTHVFEIRVDPAQLHPLRPNSPIEFSPTDLVVPRCQVTYCGPTSNWPGRPR